MKRYTSKEQLIEALKVQIANSEDKALAALKKIYANQTRDEKSSNTTRHHNDIGFTIQDAKKLSRFASIYIHCGKEKLYPSTIETIKKAMPKYAGQLIDMSIESGKIKKEGNEYVW